MMYSKKIIYLFLFLALHTLSYSQVDKAKIGINTTDPMRTLDVNGDMRITKTIEQIIRDVKTITSSGTYSISTTIGATHKRVLVQTTETKTVSYEENGVTKTKTINLGYVDTMDLDALNPVNTPERVFKVFDVPNAVNPSGGNTQEGTAVGIEIGDIRIKFVRYDQGQNRNLKLYFQLKQDSYLSQDFLTGQVFFFGGYVQGAEAIINDDRVHLRGEANERILSDVSPQSKLTNNYTANWLNVDGRPNSLNINNSTIKSYLKSIHTGKIYFIYVKVYFQYDIESEFDVNGRKNVIKASGQVENNPRRLMIYSTVVN